MFFSGSAFSGHPAADWEKPRDEIAEDGSVVTVNIKLRQPGLVQKYYECCGVIDLANRYRQGALKLEKIWRTHSWQLRIFQSIMGIILVNSMLAFNYDQNDCYTLFDFTNAISWELTRRTRAPNPDQDRILKLGDRSASPPDSSLIWGSSGHSGWI